MDVRICAPWSLQPSERVQEIAGKLAAESGALLTVTADVLPRWPGRTSCTPTSGFHGRVGHRLV
jgi:Ornithine carbamoyltransferase